MFPRRPRPFLAFFLLSAAFAACGGTDDPTDAAALPERVVALGRIEPDELVRLAGPARFAVVVASLEVAEGDDVEVGQEVAVLDSAGVEEAEVAAARAEVEDAERALARAQSLSRQRVSAQADTDAAFSRRDLAAARLRQAEAELARSRVRSPVAGRVIAVHTRAGEKVGLEGIVEIADRSPMTAIAEVYESDVPKVRLRQRAIARSAAIEGGEVRGVVTRIGSRIGRRDVLDSDPVAAVDARVVEVEVTLEEDEKVADLIHLQVEVELLPELGPAPPPPLPIPAAPAVPAATTGGG